MIQKAFTRTELLIGLAVAGVVGAMMVPIFRQMQDKHIQDLCISNERHLGVALAEYTQDNDQTYPWSFSASDNTPTWEQLVSRYIKGQDNSMSAFQCPGEATTGSAYSTNSQIVGLLDTEHKTPSLGWYGSVIHGAQIQNPHNIVLLGDALLQSAQTAASTDPRRAAFDFAYPHPSDMKNHTSDEGWDQPWFSIPSNDHQISWRHSTGANFIYCDGHAQHSMPGALKDVNWDVRCRYGKPCDGSPDSPVYPAPDGSCGDQSPINCN